MKRLLPVLFGFALLLLSSTEGWSLPPCPGSYNKTTWTDCFGTFTFVKQKRYFGDKYVGEWKNGKYHGQGTYYFLADNKVKGDKYVGHFKNGKKSGQGTYYFLADNKSKGDKYVGEWKDRKPHGQGTYTYANGDKYVGEYKDGKKNGRGIHTYADGRIEEGIFENGKFLYTKKKSPVITNKKSPLDKAKEQCAEIGFTKGTEKFGECVMRLLK